MLVLLALLPVVAILTWSALQAREQRIHNAYMVVQNVARMSAAAQQRLFASARLLLMGLAESPGLRASGRCGPELAQLRLTLPHLVNLGLADARGKVLCSALPVARTAGFVRRGFVARALERGSFAADGYRGARGRGGVVAFGLPVKDVGGADASVAFAVFDAGAFNLFPDAARLPAHPQFLTVDGRGVVLAAAPAGAAAVGRPLAVAPLRAALHSGRAGIMKVAGPQGGPLLYAFAPARLAAGEAALSVVIGVPLRSVVAPVDDTLLRSLALLATVALLFCGLAWIAYERWVVRPVGRLAAAADAVAAGELSTRASGAGPVAEYAGMQERFNRMAQRLEARERLLAGLVEVSADWYWEQDVELRFKDFSDNVLRQHFPMAQYLGKQRWEVPHFGVSEAQWAEHRATLAARQPFRDFIVGRYDDQGRRRYLSLNGRPTYDPSGAFTGYQGVSTDVTERAVAEEALRASEARYRRLIELSPDAVFMQRDGRILFMNPAGARLYGARLPAELDGRPVLDLVDSTARPLVAQRIAAMHARGDVPPIAEILQRRLDGSTFYAEVHTTPIEVDGAAAALSVVRDVSARRRMEEALRASEEQYRALFEKNPSPMWVFAHDDRRFLAVNEAAVAHYGYTKAEFLAMTLRDVHPEEELPRLSTERMEARAAAMNHGRWRHRRKDGSVIDVQVRSYGIAFEGVLAHLALVTDVTERLRHQREIEYLATHDSLTGLPNRSLLADLAPQVLSSARRRGHSAALLLFDLDNFKLHNDSFGHHGGDLLLREVSARIARVLRDGDTLARLGGDEFVALLADLRRPEDVAAVVAKIRAALGEPFTVGGREVFATASIGVSMFPGDGHDLDSLVRHADTAMYKAKELGRDDVQYFTPELNRRAAERLAIEAELRRALERTEFAIFYQPLVDVRSRAMVGAEALIRWNHPRQGIVPPGRFIQIAEDSGLIVAIGTWVLREGCRQLRAWHDGGLSGIRLAFNVSARQFRDKAYVATVRDAMAGAGLRGEHIELELTESMVMGSAERFEQGLKQFKHMGVGLAIDDFGTGYSSLSYLKRFPIDKLKIDQSFVRHLERDADDAAIVQTVISLGRSLKLRVIAEGVESYQQLDFLRRHGCDEVQGYYVAKPMPAAEFEQLARRGLPARLWSPGAQ